MLTLYRHKDQWRWIDNKTNLCHDYVQQTNKQQQQPCSWNMWDSTLSCASVFTPGGRKPPGFTHWESQRANMQPTDRLKTTCISWAPRLLIVSRGEGLCVQIICLGQWTGWHSNSRSQYCGKINLHGTVLHVEVHRWSSKDFIIKQKFIIKDDSGSFIVVLSPQLRKICPE